MAYFPNINKQVRDSVRNKIAKMIANTLPDAAEQSGYHKMLNDDKYFDSLSLDERLATVLFINYMAKRSPESTAELEHQPGTVLQAMEVSQEEADIFNDMLSDNSFDWDAFDIEEHNDPAYTAPEDPLDYKSGGNVTFEGKTHCPLAAQMWRTVRMSKLANSLYDHVKEETESGLQSVSQAKAAYILLNEKIKDRQENPPRNIFKRISNFFERRKETALRNQIGESLKEIGADEDLDFQKSLANAGKVFDFSQNEVGLKSSFETPPAEQSSKGIPLDIKEEELLSPSEQQIEMQELSPFLETAAENERTAENKVDLQ